MSKVTTIKKDAKITITMGTGFVEAIQKVLINLSSEKSSEETAKFHKLATENNTKDLEPWMFNVLTVASLLKEIETEAVKQNLTIEEDSSSVLPNL